MTAGTTFSSKQKDTEQPEEIKEADEGEELGFTSRIPSDLTLKLVILGKAFAGKKTVAV